MCVVISRANVVRSIRQTEFCESPMGASLAIRKTNAATGSVINFVFGHNMLQRCMYADQEKTGP